MSTKPPTTPELPEHVTPHLQLAIRGALRHVYVRWVWREKRNARRHGKVRGSGPSRIRSRTLYLGREHDVIATLLTIHRRRRA
jgi:hypothetical protein